MVDSPRTPPKPVELADTVLADSGTLQGAHGFDLATGEADVVPVFVDDSVPASLESGRYEEGPLLGAGGMGEVCLFRDRRVGRHVALKKLLPGVDTEVSRRRFLREARVQGQLEHPAIVPVYDVDFDENGLPYFSMKRVKGQTLARVLELLARNDEETKQRFGRRRLLSAFVQVCHAVHYAHVRGVVHRDLKPGNIMLGEYGEVYVLDWGVARIIREPDEDVRVDPKLAVVMEASTGLTRHGDLVGSVGYMAPEQMHGDSNLIDARADVFSLGIVLYEILTHRRFREGGSLPAVVDRVLKGEKKLPSDLAPDVPPELDALCARCTFRQPDDRIQSAGELAEALERYLEGDRDREARRSLAKEHAERAEERIRGAQADSAARTQALGDVMKALAFDPENARAQALLFQLLVEVKGPIPAEAEAELATVVEAQRSRGARLAAWGFCSMMLTFVLALWLGIKSWTGILVLTLSCGACAGFSLFASKRSRQTAYTYVLAVLAAILVASVSMLVGPFVMVPALAAAFAMFFVAHVSPAERRFVIAALVAGSVLPFGIEALGWFPPAYAFEPGRIVLFSRVIDFPPVPSIASLVYTNITFVALPAIFAGWLHDELARAQRRMAFQAWQLKQVFPELE
jgi:serine/threonine-protein kinase